MSASGAHGWPLAGIAQTRTVAPANGTPRELKTISSLRVPCPFATGTIGHAWNISVSATQRNPITLFDRIMYESFARFTKIFDFWALYSCFVSNGQSQSTNYRSIASPQRRVWVRFLDPWQHLSIASAFSRLPIPL